MRRPKPGLLGELLFALLAGGVWALAFGRSVWWPLAWLGLAPLPWLLTRRRPLRLAFLHGFGFWAAAMPWIAHTLRVYGGLSAPLSWLLLGLLASYLGLYSAAFGWLGGSLMRRAADPAAGVGATLVALLGLPAVWVVLELLRGVMISGFPWNLAAYAWLEIPGALPLSSWIGAWGVSFLVVLVAVATALAGVRRRWEPLVSVWLLALGLLAVAARYGGGKAQLTPHRIDLGPSLGASAGETSGGVPRGARAGGPVRVVQPNIPIATTFDPRVTIEQLEGLFAQSAAACDRDGALLVWPESAAWPYVYGEDPYLDAEIRALAARGCPVLVNAPRRDGTRTLNALLLVDSDGVVGVAGKRHLVPFGEYVPLGTVFPFIGRLARAAGDFSPAGDVTLLPWGAERLGAAICFEVIFPAETAALVRAGATLLVTVTNDAWYGDSAAPWQHLAAARFRAAELRRPLLRAALTGVSAIIGPDGRMHASAGVGARDVLRADVRGRIDLSPFARRPWLVPVLCGLLAVAAISWNLWRPPSPRAKDSPT